MRIGLLSASRISVPALIEPAAGNDRVELAAVGARTPEAAEKFATDHGIPRAYASYAELIADETLDAIYVSNPASLHASWAIAALEAGKQVLCEKPLAGNADDAGRMVETAASAGRVLMEAFHWRFHPFADRMIEMVTALDRPITIDTEFSVPRVPEGDIRHQLALGGGALMDLGCYPVHWVRSILGEPSSIEAEMEVAAPSVDSVTRAILGFSDGSTAYLRASMADDRVVRRLDATGGNGSVTAINPVSPHTGNRLSWDIDGLTGVEEVPGPTTYQAQLDNFVGAAAGDEPQLVTGQDSVANMAVIDAMYRGAGLGPRP
jgi:predicted dehydrogenase